MTKPTTIHPIHFVKFLREQTRAGKKTLTHRVIKPQPQLDLGHTVAYDKERGMWGWLNTPVKTEIFYSKYGTAGHKLWMHEPVVVMDKVIKGEVELRYLDDDECRIMKVPDRIVHPLPGRWGGRTLPSEWARDWMEVEKVVCHHIQDITEDEAKTEGLRSFTKDGVLFKYWPCDPCSGDLKCAWVDLPRTATEAFGKLWDSINGPRGYAWDKNPWAFGITYSYLPRTPKV